MYDPENHTDKSETFLESLGEPETYSLVNGFPQLIQDPDLTSLHLIREYFPAYAWHVRLEGIYMVDMFINAETGEVCGANIDLRN